MGLFGSFFYSLAFTSISTAFSSGPAGPVAALSSLSALFLVIIEVYKTHECPQTMELVAFAIGFIGSIILVVPEWFKCKK